MYISKSSWLIFGICSMVLAISFSLIFGYKASLIEIVDYLKKES